MRSTDRSAGPLRWLKAALTGLLPTPPTPVQISKGLSLWLDEKRGSRHAVAHLEVRTITPEGVRLPITETGYRSHHLSPVYVDQAGGPVAYAVAWLDAEARKPEWRRYVEASRQLSLF